MKSYLLVFPCIIGLCVQAVADSVRVSDLTSKPQLIKTLTGREASELLKAFNDLPWDHSSGKRCHFPAYRIEHLTGDAVVLDATVCFTCNNVRFSKPEDKGLQGFDTAGKGSKHLQTKLEGLFSAQ